MNTPRRSAATRLCSPDTELQPLVRVIDGDPMVGGPGHDVLTAAIAEIDGARWASITFANRRSLVTATATDAVARRLDRLQLDTGQGPSLPATHPVVAVHSADLAHDRRWPAYGAVAADHGAAALLSYRILSAPQHVGAFTVYADHSYAFGDDDDQFAQLLAAHLACAWATVPAVAVDRPPPLRTRDTIGQAKGILQERHRITDQQAFTELLRSARRTGHKLSAVAAHLTMTGHLPG